MKNLRRSCEFYERLGFRQVGGNRKKGWAIFERDGYRIDLFHGYIPDNLLNYRGGHIAQIVERLRARGLVPYDVKVLKAPGTGRAMLKDPDGNVIFFDTTKRERTLRRQSARRR